MITYRDLRSIDDCRQVVELEKLVWGYTDAEDVVPVPILVVAIKRGGILVGAFEGERMVGFVYSLPGIKDGRPTQWSDMLGVLQSHRAAGVGHRLKLEQRDRTLEMGLDLVEWTYDPMQAVNAHLNFEKLGVVSTEYEENIYGESSSPLHRGTPTDRLVAEWRVGTARVEARVNGTRTDRSPAFGGAIAANVTAMTHEGLTCLNYDLTLDAPRVIVEIPVGFTGMQAERPALAREWRMSTRDLFVTYLGRGYTAVEFMLDRKHGRGRYLLANDYDFDGRTV